MITKHNIALIKPLLFRWVSARVERHNSVANALEFCLFCTNPNVVLWCKAKSHKQCYSGVKTWAYQVYSWDRPTPPWSKFIHAILRLILEMAGHLWWTVETWCQFLFGNVNSSPPGQNGRHFADDICKCIFMNEKFCILIQISLKFVPKGLIDNKTALVQVMAWRRTGNKPLPEAVLI